MFKGLSDKEIQSATDTLLRDIETHFTMIDIVVRNIAPLVIEAAENL